MPGENPFDQLTKGSRNKGTDFADVEVKEEKEAKEEIVEEEDTKKRKGRKENPAYLVKTAQCMYRLSESFYDEIKAFARLKGISVNSLMEEAVLAYLTNNDNKSTYLLAKQIAETESKNRKK